MWKRNFGRKTFVFWRLKRGSCVKGRCSLQKGILHTELSVRIGRAMIQAGNGRIFTVHPCVFFFCEQSGYGRDFSLSTSLLPILMNGIIRCIVW